MWNNTKLFLKMILSFYTSLYPSFSALSMIRFPPFTGLVSVKLIVTCIFLISSKIENLFPCFSTVPFPCWRDSYLWFLSFFNKKAYFFLLIWNCSLYILDINCISIWRATINYISHLWASFFTLWYWLINTVF